MPRNLRTTFAIDDVVVDRVVEFRQEERLGRPPTLVIEFRLTSYVPLDNLLGHAARLEYGFAGEPMSVFTGIVQDAAVVGTSLTADSAHQYVLEVVPKIALLSRDVDCRIFQELDVKEIVDQVLTDRGITDTEWRLTGSYPKRTYCVQYNESCLDFIHRLLEEEGIYYFVEPGDEGEKVIFADDSPSAAPLEGGAALPVRPKTEMGVEEDALRLPTDVERVRSGAFTLSDYNFENPSLDLFCTAEADAHPELEIYDHPGDYEEPSEGKRLAQVRLEAEQAWRSTLHVQGQCPRLHAGRIVEIVDAGDLDGEYFVVAATQLLDDETREGERDGLDFGVKASLIPKDVVYRAPQRTPKPLIHGPQTAVVVAPGDAQPETTHTDEHGRVKVHFHWDRHGKMDDTDSCWMRVSQMQTSGSLVLPRNDWEVVVEFVEGNPDRPVVTGRLYNGTFKPPYALPEGKTRTAIKTASSPGGGGVNEIRFEDKAGAEEIMIHAQKDMTLATANNKKKSVGNNETTVIGANASLNVGANQTVKVTKGSQNTIGADQTVSVGGNRDLEVNAVAGLTVGGTAKTTVGSDQFEMNGNPLEALLALAAQAAQEFLEAKANEAIAAVQGHVQGAVDQALGPISDLTARAESLGNNMQAIADGDMGAIGGMVGDASGIPGAGDMARAMGGEGQGGPAGGPLSDVVSGGNMITEAAGNLVQAGAGGASNLAGQAIGGGVNAAHRALADAMGVEARGVDGESLDNAAGPEGDVGGQDETDRAKGPGHHIGKIAGSHAEKVSGNKVTGVLTGIDTNVAGSMTQNAGAAHIEIIVGDRAEAAEGSKTETALGLVVLTKAGESESVAGAKTCMVGGAIVDKLKGTHSVEAGGPATFIGAYHKLEAKGAITLTCGASEMVIDGKGITITSPMVTMMAGKIQLPKDVAEV